jgi:hypothetical protein
MNLRWVVERVDRSLWIAYRSDLDKARIFRTWKHAHAYAASGGTA